VTDSVLRELADDPSSRKRFFKTLGGAGAVSAFTVLLAACGDDDKENGSSRSSSSSTSSKQDNASDLKIVNYALTLEYLEADFYAKVIDSGIIKDKATVDLAKRFGETEQQHVDGLKAAAKSLGGTPVKAPKTNFDDVLGGGQKRILATAATVENLGAAAYLGEAANIKSREILASALAIHTVEARHAAALNILIGRGFGGKGGLEGAIPDGAFAKPMGMKDVLAAAKPFLA